MQVKVPLQVRVLSATARTLKAHAAFEGLNANELAENMILHCMNDDRLLKQLIAECQQIKAQAKAQAKQAA